MCGIAGLITKSCTPDISALNQASRMLEHRGPDHQDAVIRENVGLVHSRLSIIDLANGDQPLYSQNRNQALIVNGEIYNYKELMTNHEGLGRQYSSRSDSETILHELSLHGYEGLKNLHGMFAFAMHDQNAKTVTIARDRLGIKPLYFSKQADRVVFASEIKALLPLMNKPPTVNHNALVQFLQNQFSSGRDTIFNEISRVLPGEVITIDANLELHQEQYWTPLDVSTRELNFNQAAEEFEPLFEQVMLEHMRSDVPFGLFLSGGVDSLSHLPRTIWACDDLMRDYACIPTSVMAEIAAQDLKVVFTGEGGDEVFAGYGRYRKSKPERFLRNLIHPGSGGFRTRGQLKRTAMGKLLKKKPAANYREPFIQAWQTAPAHWSDVQKSQYTDISSALPDNLLSKVDRITMSFGLEARVPFLDHRIVEFGLSLPDQLKIQSGHGKFFLKKWAEKYIPKDHLQKKKTGFNVPVSDWLDKPMLNDLQSAVNANQNLAEFFDMNSVNSTFEAHRAGRKHTREIWCVMQFSIWHTMMHKRLGGYEPSARV